MVYVLVEDGVDIQCRHPCVPEGPAATVVWKVLQVWYHAQADGVVVVADEGLVHVPEERQALVRGGEHPRLLAVLLSLADLVVSLARFRIHAVGDVAVPCHGDAAVESRLIQGVAVNHNGPLVCDGHAGVVGSLYGCAVWREVIAARHGWVAVGLQAVVQGHGQRVRRVVDIPDHHPHRVVRSVFRGGVAVRDGSVLRQQVVDLGVDDVAVVERRIVIVVALVHPEKQPSTGSVVHMLNLAALCEGVVRLHQLQAVDHQFHDTHEPAHLQAVGLDDPTDGIHEDTLAVGEPAAGSAALQVVREYQADEVADALWRDGRAAVIGPVAQVVAEASLQERYQPLAESDESGGFVVVDLGDVFSVNERPDNCQYIVLAEPVLWQSFCECRVAKQEGGDGGQCRHSPVLGIGILCRNQGPSAQYLPRELN